MMGPTHEKFGAVCAAAIYPAPLISIPMAWLFATWPDLDKTPSTASNRFPLLGWMVRLWAGGHRRRTHLLGRRSQLQPGLVAAYVALVAGLFWLWSPLGWGFAIGYTSHLVGDWIFDGNRRWRPKTNGWTEKKLKAILPALFVAGLGLRLWIWL